MKIFTIFFLQKNIIQPLKSFLEKAYIASIASIILWRTSPDTRYNEIFLRNKDSGAFSREVLCDKSVLRKYATVSVLWNYNASMISSINNICCSWKIKIQKCFGKVFSRDESINKFPWNMRQVSHCHYCVTMRLLVESLLECDVTAAIWFLSNWRSHIMILLRFKIMGYLAHNVKKTRTVERMILHCIENVKLSWSPFIIIPTILNSSGLASA